MKTATTLIFCLTLLLVNGQTFTSNLPIVLLNTNGAIIVDEPKVTIYMGIIDNGIGNINSINDPHNGYSGNIGIELRGNSTMYHPKKSWNLELRDALGMDIDAPIMGMPAEEDWILKASYLDKTFLRDVIPFKMWREMGYWAPRTKMCELFLDGDYKGIYIMYEKIKRDNNRVDIAKLDSTEISGDDLTGGYIIGIGGADDEWMSNYTATTGDDLYYHLRYPKPANVRPEQLNYIKSYIDSFEIAVNSSTYYDPQGNHYSHFIDMKSFVHHFIINEVSRNVDGLKQSTYWHKDKDSKGGKLMFSALWDYDVAYGNIDYCSSGLTDGWAYEYPCPWEWFGSVPRYWERLMADPWFKEMLKCEWDELRQTTLSLPNIFADIDSVAAYIDSAQMRNFTEWPVLGVDLESFPGPVPTTFQGEIDYLKNWYTNRIAWLDANITGTCNVGIPSLGIESEIDVTMNNASDVIEIVSYSNVKSDVVVFDQMGQVLYNGSFDNSLSVRTSSWSTGIYLVQVKNSKGFRTKRIFNN